MNRYLVAPVKVDGEKITTTGEWKLIEAKDTDTALEQAAFHTPLHIGEQFAITKIGRVLNAEAGDKLNLGQSGG